MLLDTTVLIDVLRERRAAVDLLRGAFQQGPPPFVCAINVEEVWRGARAREEEAVSDLFAGLRVAPLGAREGKRAGNWRRDFSSRGVTLEQADCLIAAAAVGVGARLATGNPKDFPMSGLEIEHWPTGE
ncbi:MAG: PIN domain-containing protein [Actinomycetota bacterium]|nr:PIN domain-containing protein [Actinomycetota bacterium]